MLNKPLAIVVLSGLALTSSLPIPATAASFNWFFNGDGYGEATLSFNEWDETVSPQFMASGQTGTFTAADLGTSAAFNYFLNVQDERFSATDFGGVDPGSATFIFDNGSLTGYNWTDVGDNRGWNLTVTSERWFTVDPSNVAPSYSLVMYSWSPSYDYILLPYVPVPDAVLVVPSISPQAVPEGSSHIALFSLGICLVLQGIKASSRLG